MFISTILSPTRAEMTQSEAAYPKHLSGIPQRIVKVLIIVRSLSSMPLIVSQQKLKFKEWIKDLLCPSAKRCLSILSTDGAWPPSYSSTLCLAEDLLCMHIPK